MSRHLVATFLFDNEVDIYIYTVSKTLNHSNIK